MTSNGHEISSSPLSSGPPVYPVHQDLGSNANEELNISSPQNDDVLESINPHANFKVILENLKQIFPKRDPEELTTVALKNVNVHDAINEILDSVLDENSSSGR